MFVPSLGWMSNGNLVCQHSLVDVKYPVVPFVKSRQVIPGTMKKLLIHSPTSRGQLHQRHSHALGKWCYHAALCCIKTKTCSLVQLEYFR